MHKEGTVVYEMETQYTKVSRTTGKEYKVWKFTAISPIDVKGKQTIKGKWLIIETLYGKVRFNLETEYKVTYESAPVEEVEEVEEMKVSISKKPGEWNVLVNGKVFGECRNSTKHGGSIEAELHDGVIINAFSQSSLKGMIKRHLIEDEQWAKMSAAQYQNTEIYNVFINSYDDFFNEENKELITKEPVTHSQAVTIDRGIDINLNHNDYYTSIEKVEAPTEKRSKLPTNYTIDELSPGIQKAIHEKLDCSFDTFLKLAEKHEWFFTLWGDSDKMGDYQRIAAEVREI